MYSIDESMSFVPSVSYSRGPVKDRDLSTSLLIFLIEPMSPKFCL